MDLLNIGAGNKDDAFYRYKMPKMITKIEGRGNGIKTNIVNMADIAKALGRPGSYTTKYFGCELGAQSKFDEKTGTSHVNGSHDTAKLSALLEVFIKKYVQCYECGNPETEINITKSQMINLNCAACGFISHVDMRDKLTTFIVKNPPEQKKGPKDKKAMRRAEKERMKEGEIADEEQKRLKKEAAKKKGISGGSKDVVSKASGKKKANISEEDGSPVSSLGDENEARGADDSDDDVQWQTDTSMEAARQRIQEQLNSVTAGMVMLSTNEENSNSGTNSPARDKKSKFNGQGNALKSVRSRDRLDKIKGNGQGSGLKSVRSHDRLDKINNSGQTNRLKAVCSHDRLDKIKDHGQVNGIKPVRSRGRLDKVRDDGQVSRLKSVSSSERLDEIKDDALGETGLNSVDSHDRLAGEIIDYLKNSPTAGQLKSFLGSLSGTQQDIVDSLFEALFNEIGKGFSKEVLKKKNYLAVATSEDGSQSVLLHAIESFCQKASPDAVKEVALVLKALYDIDMLEEEFILEWYVKGVKGSNNNSPVWKNVKPFVEWLQSAESESEGQ